MLLKIKAWIPNPIKLSIKKLWHVIRPPKIKLTKFVEGGCYFEVTSKTEEYRVSSYGDEIESIRNVLLELKPGDVFFDIGSCVGIYALHAALFGSSVFAFEPDPEYRKRLKKNIQINRMKKKIKVIEWAVSDYVGKASLYTDGINGNSPSLLSDSERCFVTVKTDSLDNAISNHLIPFPDVIKIDIEGAEILALRGMKNTLASRNAPRFLFLELHPKYLSSFNSSMKECENIIDTFGYVKLLSYNRSNQIHSFYKKEIN